MLMKRKCERRIIVKNPTYSQYFSIMQERARGGNDVCDTEMKITYF